MKLLLCALLCLAPLPVLAAPAPDAGSDVLFQARVAGEDLLEAVITARGEIDVARNLRTNAPAGFPGVVSAACETQQGLLKEGFGHYVAGAIKRPKEGVAPIASRMTREMGVTLNRGARAVDGAPTKAFLVAGDTLSQAPRDWNAALRQRAEWDYYLQLVRDDLATKANPEEFGATYGAGLWARTTCRFRERHQAFLDAYRAGAGDAPLDAATAKALTYLETFTVKANS